MSERTRLQRKADFLFSLGFEEQRPRTYVRINVKNEQRLCVERIMLDDDGDVIEGSMPVYRVITRTWAQGKEKFQEPSLWERLDEYGEMQLPQTDAVNS